MKCKKNICSKNSSRKPSKKFLHFKLSYTSKCKIQNVRVQQHDLRLQNNFDLNVNRENKK